MSSLVSALRAANADLEQRLTGGLHDDALHDLADDDLFAVMRESAELIRRGEAALVEAIGEVRRRSDSPIKTERATYKAGCGSVRELVQRCTRASHRQIRMYERLAGSLQREVALTTGEMLPSKYPQLREALLDGEIGADALTLALGPVSEAEPRIGGDGRAFVDATLAAHARGVPPRFDTDLDGTGIDDAGIDDTELGDATDAAHAPPGELPESADDLRARAQLLVTVLDEDGAEPREAMAMRRRGLTIGPEREGLVSVRGNLLPEVGAQLRLVLDAITNPKVGVPEFRPSGRDGSGDDLAAAEERTRPQLTHDAFANAITVLARSGQVPQIGGAAPTLVVSVRAEDLVDGLAENRGEQHGGRRGWAHVQGSAEPVSLAVARHIACTGQVQRVVQGRGGRILAIGITDRIFAAHQRRAIVLRDGGCIIPGCSVPASWCEIHHVQEFAKRGPTHTDNGVTVCWHHHRMLEVDGWEIRMRDGVPQVRAPARWDPERRWRSTTKSRVRPLEPPDRQTG